jgi:hypothetical protein
MQPHTRQTSSRGSLRYSRRRGDVIPSGFDGRLFSVARYATAPLLTTHDYREARRHHHGADARQHDTVGTLHSRVLLWRVRVCRFQLNAMVVPVDLELDAQELTTLVAPQPYDLVLAQVSAHSIHQNLEMKGGLDLVLHQDSLIVARGFAHNVQEPAEPANGSWLN